MGNTRFAAGRFASAIITALGLAALSACAGKVDDRFSAESYDEYTQPLTNVVVGTPTGVVRGATIATNGQIIGGVTEPVVATATGSASSSTSSGPTSTPPGSGGATSGAGGVPAGSSGGGGGGGGGGSSSSGGGVPTRDAGTGGPSDGGFGTEAGAGGSSGGFGQWHFDDCSPSSNFLIDSSGFGANAQHALAASCVPGISGLGVGIRTAKDVVQVPDEPQFTVSSLIALAAWVHPNTVTGNQPIIIKRLNSDTAFSLGIHNGNIEMSVVLASRTTVISRAPISPGVWTHVAGMYDGTFVFLFINGQQFGQVFGGGPLHNVFAPLRIGATTQSQHFDGIIDEVFVSTEAISKDTLTALACLPRSSTLTMTPATSGPVAFDTSFHYDMMVTDNDVGFCQARNYSAFSGFFDPTIGVNFENSFQQVQPGGSATFGVDVTASEEADPGDDLLSFGVEDFTPPFNFEEVFTQVTFTVAEPTGCFVFTKRELMITSTSVVDDPIRTFGNGQGGFSVGGGGGGFDGGISVDSSIASFDASARPTSDGGFFSPDTGTGTGTPGDGGSSASQGVWSFAHLMREMAPTPDQAPAMVLQLFQHWLTPQTVNGFSVAARPAAQQEIIDIWPKMPNGDLDLDQAPLTLEAVVNRIDVRNLAAGSAGEGRFIFGMNGPTFPDFTVIVEYNLPAQTQDDVMGWANQWHALGSHPFPSEEYSAALEAITRRFTDRNAQPGAVNGSALAELRTNDFSLSGFTRWELRSFALSATSGFFDEVTVKETPDISFNETTTLADFVNQNAAAIKAVVPGANGNTVPLQFEGRNFLGGSAFNDFFEWGAPGITDPDARFHQSLNTCNGCHGPETNTNFQMVVPRFSGNEATLSQFLTGTTAFDQFTGQTRQLNDLKRRNVDLTGLVCGSDGGTVSPPPTDGGAVTPPFEGEGGVISPPPFGGGVE